MKHPVMEILENGGVVSGEEFDMMLREEAKTGNDEMLRMLKEIKSDIEDIKKAIQLEILYADSEKKITAKCINNR